MRPTPHQEGHRKGHREDIEGLRSVAVLLVLLYHAGLSWFGGGFVGVDVFFVLSGFLITGILVRELDTTGTIKLLRFYAKRARRLLPASFAVLLFVSVIVFAVPRWAPNIVTPQLYGRSISWDIQRSALYIVNWLFAERSVDYHGGSALASPVQHFWSLSIEEQFYAVWPVVMLSTSLVFARSKRALVLVLGAVTLASLAYSIWLTQTSPDQAYFVTTARAWELSLGGLGALAVPTVNRWAVNRLIAPIASAAVTVGLIAIVASAVAMDASTAFPGAAALVPTLGTLGVLLAAPHAGLSRGVRWLSAPSLQWLGARSYSLYLWHWPVLWLGIAILGPTPVSVRLVLVAVSIVPAMASYRWVEQPWRTADFLVTLPMGGLALTGVTAVAGFALGAALLASTTGPSVVARQQDGVSTEVLGVQLRSSELSPAFSQVRYDLPDGYAGGCIVDRFSETDGHCSLGDPSSDLTVLVIGNSHAAHWVPALGALAEDHGWHLLTNIRSTCRLPAAIAGPDQCESWASKTMANLASTVAAADVDLVLTMPNTLSDTSIDDHLAAAEFGRVYKQLSALPVASAMISPTPHGKVIGVDCPPPVLAALDACATPRDEALRGSDVLLAAARNAGLSVIDMNRFMCTDTTCPAVVDDVVVRRDRHHLTSTFSRALAVPLGEELFGRFPWLEGE